MNQILIRSVVLLLIILSGFQMQANNSISYTATYNQNLITCDSAFLSGNIYTTVHYEGLHNEGTPGKPSLPVDYISFSVPYNATNFTVSVSDLNSTNIAVKYLVYPNQRFSAKPDTMDWVVTPPDYSVYFNSGFFPELQNMAWVINEGFLAGENHIVTVAVMPIAFRHRSTGSVNNILRIAQSFKLTLSYETGDLSRSYPIFTKDSVLRNEGHLQTQRMVANPDSVIVYAERFSIMANSMSYNTINSPQSIDETPYPYLIITTPIFKHALRRIVGLKRQKGYNVKIATIEEVLSDPLAQCGDVFGEEPFLGDTLYTDRAGILRQYIRNAYVHNGTKYVLFVGDSIPYRTINVVYPNSNDTILNVQTDLYYSDLNSLWDENDAVGLDRYTEIRVGRILASEEEQITNYTDKLFRFELNPGNGDLSYLSSRLCTVCKDLSYYCELDDDPDDGPYDNEMIESTDNLYGIGHIATDKIRESRCSAYPTGSVIVDSINNHQYGILSFLNDACPYGIITYGANNESLTYYLWAIDSVHVNQNNEVYELDTNVNNGLNNISNKLYPSICFSAGSKTMPFEMPSQLNNYKCFGESFTTGKDYGGPAFMGNTNIDPGFTSLFSESCFARELTNANTIIGSAFWGSKAQRSYFSYSDYVNNLLGDPELPVWCGDLVSLPNTFTSVVRTDNSISVSSNNGGQSADIVSICSNDGVTKKGSYQLFSNISPNSMVMVYSNSRIPYIVPLLLQNEVISNSQYVIANEVIAGRSVDNIRTHGDLIIDSGIEYEIEASGKVTLQDGFKVERGATFAVYPSCF